MKNSLLIYVFMALFCVSLTQAQTKIPLIIDADTANEVDDLFALVRAINAPEFNLLGITSAQFHTSPLATDSTVVESQRINEKIIELLKVKNIALPLGANKPLADKHKPMPSPASAFIIKKAHQATINNKLHVVILGSCTNVASAILTDPSIISKIKVHYLGFWHNPKTNSYNKKEFNSGNDVIAVNVLLNTPKLDLSVMTATTSQHLVFTKKTVDSKLKGKGGIANYLVNRWETYKRWWTKKDPKQKKWIMWDVAIIEALAHPEFTKSNTFLTPAENTQRHISIYTHIDTKKMEADFWQHFKTLLNK
ncbi:nucleoside hydrolase [Seonamhaeicola algicola]|nr:nucleoside hydrolase [Seonamhaeicola algicola]